MALNKSIQLTLTDCDEAGDYIVSHVLSPRDLVSRPDNMDEIVLSSLFTFFITSKQSLSILIKLLQKTE